MPYSVLFLCILWSPFPLITVCCLVLMRDHSEILVDQRREDRPKATTMLRYTLSSSYYRPSKQTQLLYIARNTDPLAATYRYCFSQTRHCAMCTLCILLYLILTATVRWVQIYIIPILQITLRWGHYRAKQLVLR